MIRSQALLIWTAPSGGGQSPVFTVATNWTALVKSAYFEFPSVGGQVILACYNFAGGVGVRIFEQTLTGVGITNWQGWFVLNPGHNLYVVTNAGPVNCWVSGAMLPGPNQFPPATS